MIPGIFPENAFSFVRGYIFVRVCQSELRQRDYADDINYPGMEKHVKCISSPQHVTTAIVLSRLKNVYSWEILVLMDQPSVVSPTAAVCVVMPLSQVARPPSPASTGGAITSLMKPAKFLFQVR